MVRLGIARSRRPLVFETAFVLSICLPCPGTDETLADKAAHLGNQFARVVKDERVRSQKLGLIR
jgi:hypothetical protein